MPRIKTGILLLTALFISGCASLPDNNKRTPSFALTDTDTTTLGRAFLARQSKVAAAETESGMYLLKNGVDAFVARAALARTAERSLDVQYYLYHNDHSGGLLTYEIWNAAKRGVRVRLLLDDMDMEGKDEGLALVNAHPNIEIRIFNPFIRGKHRGTQFVTGFGSVTRRMHNKSFTADNQIAIIGGRNVGDEYFGANPNLSFGDLDVSLIGPAVRQVSHSFDLYWNSHLSYPVEVLLSEENIENAEQKIEQGLADFLVENKDSTYYQALENSELAKKIQQQKVEYHWGHATVLFDLPEKISSDREETQFHLTPKLAPYMEKIESELLVISPYFVPGKDGVEFFKSLVDKGVAVSILTNSLASNDVSIVHSGYSKYRKRLLKAGVKLYELDKATLGPKFKRNKTRKTREGISGSKASLHAKYFIMDRSRAFIGSLNLDPRSVVENTEIGAIIDSPELATELAEGFVQNIHDLAYEVKLQGNDVIWHRNRDGKIETFTTEPDTSWWDRLSVWFMKLLPAESQL